MDEILLKMLRELSSLEDNSRASIADELSVQLERTLSYKLSVERPTIKYIFDELLTLASPSTSYTTSVLSAIYYCAAILKSTLESFDISDVINHFGYYNSEQKAFVMHIVSLCHNQECKNFIESHLDNSDTLVKEAAREAMQDYGRQE